MVPLCYYPLQFKGVCILLSNCICILMYLETILIVSYKDSNADVNTTDSDSFWKTRKAI